MKRAPSREIAVCGFNAVVASLQNHPERVKRLLFNPEVAPALGRYCRQLAAQKKIYRQISNDELARAAATVHHGGVVAIIETPALKQPSPGGIEAWAGRMEPLLILDRVGNSHNLGALARSAAFFGISRMILSGAEQQAVPGAAAYRVAEGGLDHVECWQAEDLAAFCRALRRRYRVVGTALHQADALPPAADCRDWREPVALVLGNEETGISRPVRQACQHIYRIPGRGHLESLNVAAAGAVLMYHFFHDKAS